MPSVIFFYKFHELLVFLLILVERVEQNQTFETQGPLQTTENKTGFFCCKDHIVADHKFNVLPPVIEQRLRFRLDHYPPTVSL